jgi:hypothetical protein
VSGTSPAGASHRSTLADAFWRDSPGRQTFAFRFNQWHGGSDLFHCLA